MKYRLKILIMLGLLTTITTATQMQVVAEVFTEAW